MNLAQNKTLEMQMTVERELRRVQLDQRIPHHHRER